MGQECYSAQATEADQKVCAPLRHCLKSVHISTDTYCANHYVQEEKKIRRNRRKAEQQDKQDRIRMGLIPPDPPKGTSFPYL
jgi:hypothetical protein